MTANELKYTYMEEAMSILDNEELMRKALSLLRNLKEKTFSPAKRSERVGVPIVKQNMGSDPASVAFDTLSSAKANDADVVIIDTAGRLHNKINLMNELTKIKNVMKKVIPDAPHEILLVLDGSTGQNAFEQAKQFTAATEVNALAVTKLDGTAKGGVVIGISDHFRIPVKYIGLGEGMEDLQVFRKREFVNSLFGE